MHTFRTAFAAASLIALSACGQADQSDPADANTQTTVAPAPVAPSAAALTVELSEVAQRGQRIWLRCQACHSLAPDAPHSTGPNLSGLIGAAAGQKEGYTYSEALAGSGVVWNKETLDQWIAAPQQLVPGNKMVFTGLPGADDRLALIQYLEEVTAPEAYTQ